MRLPIVHRQLAAHGFFNLDGDASGADIFGHRRRLPPIAFSRLLPARFR
jgi:hypothetical protein